MRCRKARKLIWSQVEGEAAPLPAGLEEHIAGCSSCAALAREVRETWRLLGEYRAIEPQAGYRETFRARLRTAEQEERARPAAPWLAWRWLALAAGSVAIVLVIAGRMATPPGQPVEYGISPADRLDETFLDELDRALRSVNSDYLREYDSWPAGYLEGSEAEPGDLPAGKRQPAKGGHRHEDA